MSHFTGVESGEIASKVNNDDEYLDCTRDRCVSLPLMKEPRPKILDELPQAPDITTQVSPRRHFERNQDAEYFLNFLEVKFRSRSKATVELLEFQ